MSKYNNIFNLKTYNIINFLDLRYQLQTSDKGCMWCNIVFLPVKHAWILKSLFKLHALYTAHASSFLPGMKRWSEGSTFCQCNALDLMVTGCWKGKEKINYLGTNTTHTIMCERQVVVCGKTSIGDISYVGGLCPAVVVYGLTTMIIRYKLTV